ncbi:MAG: undecaprenyldiphospho-muramoylpentapeptide beta-N-acetylglucosaminyltransferase [Vallitaleaceae bacterium]|nr:undecaprenyldiphospho-muramoylpentapeptide beta-N-acetylglucosaminyltransferase [Vallitaleaceae bacterium]
MCLYFFFFFFFVQFLFFWGFFQAIHILGRFKPNIIFSKGGFVSVPVVYAAKLRRIPVIIHESDITPGLANKLCIPMATKVCTTFPDTVRYLPRDKAVYTGSPIRESILSGSKEKGYAYRGLNNEKPIVLIMGGSLGAVAINKSIRESLDSLLAKYQIIHICGAGHIDETLIGRTGYAQYEYIKAQLADIFSITDLMISRAGANALSEILALHIPHILIPLPAASSRGDQILNAESFKTQGFSYVLASEDVNSASILNAIELVQTNRETYISKMKASGSKNGVDMIVGLIGAYIK